ncbi:MAG: hypothetical protein QGG36_20705 [Pirellulaceae bacterium]|jgi:hypothetical protein|nr:hypothetical protein [Pirellulaceae bacterium]MDP7018238.1 hypothetical protein [Pirellulaceae bacterium]
MFTRLLIATTLTLFTPAALLAKVTKQTVYGYPNCLIIENATTRVVICGESGGRVLEYSLRGKNSLYLQEQETGEPRQPGRPAAMTAGRFDIGPEKVIPRHPVLWSGRWQGSVTGPNSVRVTSQVDKATGVALTRDFELAAKGTHLSCRQTIHNRSERVTEWCHWSRTFARGNGVCVIPLTANSRFPNKYVMYEDGDKINIRPTDPNIRVRDGFLEILATPKEPKLGMDSYAGWFAYFMKNDIVFVKRFPTFPNRVYNEAAGLTISIWYPEDRRVELEPIGPRERLDPGKSASFTEDWYLYEQAFPGSEKIDLAALKSRVDKLANP